MALATSGAAARAGSGEACGASGQGEANKKLTKSRSVMDPQLSPASSADIKGTDVAQLWRRDSILLVAWVGRDTPQTSLIALPWDTVPTP